MIKAISTVILLLFLMPSGISLAQEPPASIKIYSGYLHFYRAKNKHSFLDYLFFSRLQNQEEVDQEQQCSIEFRSSVPFSQEEVSVVPEKISYFIKFKNSHASDSDSSSQKNNPFDKFMIIIYTNDDEEYSIDPEAEGKQIGIGDEHHIFDSYLIYTILGKAITHLEIVNPSGHNDQNKYILDKVEVRNNS